jgi:hypothetical protein
MVNLAARLMPGDALEDEIRGPRLIRKSDATRSVRALYIKVSFTGPAERRAVR